MYSIEEFQEFFESQFLDYLPPELPSAEIRTSPGISKNGEVLTGFIIDFGASNTGTKISPCIYLEYLYRAYERSGDLEGVLQSAARTIVEAYQYMTRPGSMLSGVSGSSVPSFLTDNWQEKLNVRAVPLNSEIVRQCTPVKVVGDIAFLPYLKFKEAGEADGSFRSVVLRDDLYKILPYTRDDVVGVVNSKHFSLSEVVFMPMLEVMAELLHVPVAEIKKSNAIPDDMPDTYILTTKDKCLGAGLLFDDDLLKKISEQHKDFNDGFYVLPSSYDEILLVPLAAGDPERVAQMQVDCQSSLREEERLSDMSFIYSRDNGLVPIDNLFSSLSIV
jgi:hypothetical protein